MLMTDKHFDQKNLIFLAMAKYLSGFASYIYDVGIVIYLFSNTQSVGIVGGFFVSQLLPAIIILFTGKVIDSHSKKKLMAMANLLKGLIFVLLLFSQNIWVIYLVTFLMNLILEFEGNTLSAFMVNAFKRAIVKSFFSDKSFGFCFIIDGTCDCGFYCNVFSHSGKYHIRCSAVFTDSGMFFMHGNKFCQ